MASDGKKSPPQEIDHEEFANHFERTIQRARWAGLTERFMRRAAPTVGGLTAAFMTVSWFGAWQVMSPSLRVVGVTLFAVGLAAAIKPLLSVKKPGRAEGLARMDATTGPDRPASTYDDLPADHAKTDGRSAGVWQLERERIENSVGKFKAGWPKPNLSKSDPWKLRVAMAVVMGLSFYTAYNQGEVGERLTTAFDWQVEAPDFGPTKIDAWVKAPDYTNLQPVFIASKEQPGESAGSDFTIPARSVLNVNVHDKKAEIIMEGGTASAEEACNLSPSGEVIQCSFEFASNARLTVKGRHDEQVSWNFNVLPDRPPRVTVSPAQQDAGNEESLGLVIDVEDEYEGAKVPSIQIRPVEKSEDPDAQPLPLYNLPEIKIQVK